jgi:Stress responsive A/B Barrel Domain
LGRNGGQVRHRSRQIYSPGDTTSSTPFGSEFELIRHIVMWNIRGRGQAEKAANIATLKRSFESLRDQIPGLMTLEIGIDSSRVEYAA